MNEMVIVSGKGGTGKTTITGSLAALAHNHVIADCDVDAPNLHLLLSPEIEETGEFITSKVAIIEPDQCTKCGLCVSSCRFAAITADFQVDPILCEGCGVCHAVCPVEAVRLEDRLSGYIYKSKTKYGPMVHALLLPGESNSGKLVSLVRKHGRELAEAENKELVLIDGPPGIACSAIAAITGVTLGLIVAEPTVAAIHDLERVLQLFAHFQITPIVAINKYDLNQRKTSKIEAFCSDNRVKVAGFIPYDDEMTKAVVAGKPIVTYAPRHQLSQAIKEIWETINQYLP